MSGSAKIIGVFKLCLALLPLALVVAAAEFKQLLKAL
jgi:hypothetical protein